LGVLAAVPLGSGLCPPRVLIACLLPTPSEGFVGSVIKKRRKRMAKKKHRKLLKKTRVQRRNKK
jgi:hypothetical protein